MKPFSLFLSGCTALTLLLPQAASAYNGVYSDVRAGQHPYEARTEELSYRKYLKSHLYQNGNYTYANEVYYSPSFAKISVLHPFYRKGGVSYGGSFAQWRGYSDPTLVHEMSPETYCTNFTFQRLQYRAEPFGYQCY